MLKEEFLQNSQDVNVKIVLGNGFDLHCGLYTKYSDFYCLNWKKYFHIKRLIKDFVKGEEAFNCSKEELQSTNTWDVFFAIHSSENPKDNLERWCDIELLIKQSLTDTSLELDRNEIFSFLSNGCSINWPMVERLLSGDPKERDVQVYMSCFVKSKMQLLSWDTKRFYPFLLNELKLFEKEFGKFIYSQIHYGIYEEKTFGVVNLNNSYIQRAKFVLNSLCNIKKASIDSFNYSFIDDQEVLPKMVHINGSHEKPIFGIDSYLEPTSKRYIFTKTSRRIESEIDTFETIPNDDFDRVIIFGHSLNEADYGYFFPLFDKINLLNLAEKKIVIFAYFVWDEEIEDKIKDDLRSGISKLIYNYAKEKGISNPKRTLDSLSTQKKIITYEIPDFPERWKYFKCRLDEEWSKRYKDVQLYIDAINETQSSTNKDNK